MSVRISPLTPRSVSPPTRTGRATAAKGRCPTFRRWWGWLFTILFPPQPESRSRPRSVRGIARHSARTLGNFWVDLVRLTYYLLIPICVVFAVFLVSQGMIQNFKPYTKATLIEPVKITVEKKNDAGRDDHGRTRQPGHGRANRHRTKHRARPDGVADRDQDAGHQWWRIHQRECRTTVRKSDPALEFLPDAVDLFDRQRTYLLPRPHGQKPEARLDGLGGDDDAFCRRRASRLVGGVKRQSDSSAPRASPQLDGNMEGKEVRFGIFNSALFATITTDASCGAVNSMHDSFMPLGGFVPLFNIQLGRNHLRRRRRGPLRHAGFCRARGFHRRA